MKTVIKWVLIGIFVLILTSFGLVLIYSTLISVKQAITIAQLERGMIACMSGGTLYTDDGAEIVCGKAK